MHDRGADGIIADAARTFGGRLDRPPAAAVLCIIDQIMERYESVISALGDRSEAHAAQILETAKVLHRQRKSSPEDSASR